MRENVHNVEVLLSGEKLRKPENYTEVVQTSPLAVDIRNEVIRRGDIFLKIPIISS